MMMMKKQELRDKAGSTWARLCDTCRTVPCTVYCRADSAYLCTACDARVHGANLVASRHERVWVCEACEQAPAAFLCKADAASLCAACDADVHSANPLARRHHRVPILPIAVAGGQYCCPPAGAGGGMVGLAGDEEDSFLTPEDEEGIVEEEDETASWLLLNGPTKGDNHNDNDDNNNGYVIGGEVVDEYLDLFEYNSGSVPDSHDHQFDTKECNKQQDYGMDAVKSYGGDSVVPVQFREAKEYQHHHHHEHGFPFGIDYETKPAYNSFTTMSHSISVSSLDVGVVPDSTLSNETTPTASHPRVPTKGTIDLFSSPPPPPIQLPTQLSPMDREARVLRYREKKKTRKFEKTIRYASRKAYAETRPRIKGRFAKRSEVEEVEVDQMFSNVIMAGSRYGIVPSF